MHDTDTEQLDGVIEDLKRALARCDEAGVGLAASVHIDLALNLAVQERASMRAPEDAIPA